MENNTQNRTKLNITAIMLMLMSASFLIAWSLFKVDTLVFTIITASIAIYTLAYSIDMKISKVN